MDILHVYEQSRRLTLMEPGSQKLTEDYAAFNETVEALVAQAARDLRADGFDPSEATLALELDMLYGGQFHVKRALSPRLAIHSGEDVRAICSAFHKEFSEAFSPFVVNPEGGVFVESFVLKAVVATKKAALPEMKLEGAEPGGARKGERPVWWAGEGAARPTPIYAGELLRAGNIVEGPAVIESEYTTVVVPGTMQYRMDARGLGILEE
jgi:N-methylhydantoinase A/acetophenone carboxylase